MLRAIRPHVDRGDLRRVVDTTPHAGDCDGPGRAGWPPRTRRTAGTCRTSVAAGCHPARYSSTIARPAGVARGAGVVVTVSRPYCRQVGEGMQRPALLARPPSGTRCSAYAHGRSGTRRVLVIHGRRTTDAPLTRARDSGESDMSRVDQLADRAPRSTRRRRDFGVGSGGRRNELGSPWECSGA